jgi:hypothetical protein
MSRERLIAKLDDRVTATLFGTVVAIGLLMLASWMFEPKIEDPKDRAIRELEEAVEAINDLKRYHGFE